MEQGGSYVGIDVAKARVDVAIRPEGDRCVVANDDTGIATLVVRMQELNPAAVVLEATGGLELPLVGALAAAALPVVVVNPRQVRDFAKASGRLAKTDSWDAAVLAHFAEAVRPPLRPLRDVETQELNSLVARRQQVMTMLVAERNRLSSAAYPASEIRFPLPCWPTCPNWALSTADRSPRWWAWLPTTGTAASCGANDRLGWTGPGTHRALPGGDGSQPVQPGHQGLLPARLV